MFLAAKINRIKRVYRLANGKWWVSYRTRRNRTLTLAPDAHTYEKPGRYRVLVKVIDIFGNNTSQGYDVGV